MIGVSLLLLAATSHLAIPPADTTDSKRADYWQQRVHYTIEAHLDEEADHLDGAAVMVYHNNSPDAIDEVFFHLYLNAFRPNSRWAQVEQRAELDFQSLQDPDYAYERIGTMRMGGSELTAEYPFSPDSSVVRFALTTPIASGDSAVFSFDWEARPSTTCRRQCRRGRSYDFAQWYPRVSVYDLEGWQGHPLYPQGEFYGEYGVFDVTLDLASDQVVGATGVVIDGDPGWVPSASSPETTVRYQSDWYESRLAPNSPGMLSGEPETGRKQVRFYGEDVHHFAWSTSPEYIYEAGLHGNVPVHVLYRPEDLDWNRGVVVSRSITALEWLESVFGPYPYPQITNLHRLEGGGTEFPMLVMNGGPSQGLITHEFAHQWVMAILGSNEWKDAYLDEGMASFLDTWFAEEQGDENPWPNTVRRVGQIEAQGIPVPIATVSEEIPGMGIYGYLAYMKPSAVFYMLREHVGVDVFRQAMRLYTERKSFQHVVEDDLRKAVEDASGMDLSWFFQQWFHTTATLDYAVSDVRQEQGANGWTTTAVVTRRGEAWMPVTVQVGSERVTLDSRVRSQTVEVTTPERVTEVIVDPDVVLIDTDWSNNRVEVTQQ